MKTIKRCLKLDSDICPHQDKENCEGCELNEVYLDYKIRSNKVKRELEKENRNE